jgi:hypothetical protein
MFFFQGKLFIGKVLMNTRNFVLFTCAEHQNNSKTDLFIQTYHQYHKICFCSCFNSTITPMYLALNKMHDGMQL